MALALAERKSKLVPRLAERIAFLCEAKHSVSGSSGEEQGPPLQHLLSELVRGLEKRSQEEKILYLAVLFHLGRFAEAIVFYQQHLRAADAPGPQLIYYRSLYELKEYSLCRRAAGDDPENKPPGLRARLCLATGIAWFHCGEGDVGYLGRSLALDPTNPDIYLELACHEDWGDAGGRQRGLRYYITALATSQSGTELVDYLSKKISTLAGWE
jgi:hypothetical protein